MNNIQINFGQKKFFLNNNNDKYIRAKKEAGKDASDFEILAHYDKLAGLVQDENGKQMESGQFWSAYEKWKEEGEKMIKMLDENIDNIRETEAQLFVPLNNNVSQKRSFLGTLMTISAGIIAGLFFLFSKDSIPKGCESILAQTSGVLYTLFIFTSGFWVTAILGQESIFLDKKLKFYRGLPEEMYKKVGKEIRSEQVFNEYLREKLEESKSLNTKIYWDHEYYFYAVCGLFLLASIPIVILFLITSSN